MVAGSVESFNTARERPAPDQASRLSRSSSRSSLQVTSPDRDRKARRPSTQRRSSSVAQPHKGYAARIRSNYTRKSSTMYANIVLRRQEFSAEDEPEEVEEDWEIQRIRPQGSTGFSGMRRRSQLLRRRATQQLAGVDDASEGGVPARPEAGTGPPAEEDEAEPEEGTVRADSDSYEASEAGSVESFTLKVSSKFPLICPSERFGVDCCLGPPTSY
jgi:Ca2+:H+ antiporter